MSQRFSKDDKSTNIDIFNDDTFKEHTEDSLLYSLIHFGVSTFFLPAKIAYNCTKYSVNLSSVPVLWAI